MFSYSLINLYLYHFTKIDKGNEITLKVYVKINNNGDITDVKSSIFLKDTTGWIEIDSGFGDKYAHAQSQYFELPLIREDGKFNYKFENMQVKKAVN